MVSDPCKSETCNSKGSCMRDGATGTKCVCDEQHTGADCDEGNSLPSDVIHVCTEESVVLVALSSI